MATYAIGDVQGCYDELARLIDKLKFDVTRDTLWFCGDLVNRGGKSLEVLRLVRSIGANATVVLGNHDLSLLAIAERKPSEQNKLSEELRAVLEAPDRDALLLWLRTRKMLHVDRDLGFLMVHAGLAPGWSVHAAEAAAHGVETRLHGPNYRRLLKVMYGNKPDVWTSKLRGNDRLRASINVLTRLRFCDVRGKLAFRDKGAPGTQQPGYYPWFSVPGMVKRELRVVCGHWSTLGLFRGLGVYAIDTGCVWGGSLTAIRLDDEEPRLIRVKSTHPRIADLGD